MTVIRVTGFTIVKGTPRRGRLLVGHFDCELPGIDLRGCSLWLFSNGQLFVNPPVLDDPRRQSRAVRITDPALLAGMRDAAARACQALGGSLDWPAMGGAAEHA